VVVVVVVVDAGCWALSDATRARAAMPENILSRCEFLGGVIFI
jgi:hypothetical protein